MFYFSYTSTEEVYTSFILFLFIFACVFYPLFKKYLYSFSLDDIKTK